MAVKKNAPTEVSYENSATAASMVQYPDAPVQVVSKVVNPAPDLVVVTPKEDRTTRIAGTWYEFKRGVQIAVPETVKKELLRCNLIVEVK